MTLKTNPDAVDTTLQPNGQQAEYLILSAEERAKGFVRPVRQSYVHVGIPGPRYPLRDLTPEEKARTGWQNYVKYEQYPEGQSPSGMLWTQEKLDKVGKGCRTVTTMAVELAETYARNPSFYNGTFCCGCKTHLPVGQFGEFTWDGTNERVGT